MKIHAVTIRFCRDMLPNEDQAGVDMGAPAYRDMLRELSTEDKTLVQAELPALLRHIGGGGFDILNNTQDDVVDL